MRMIKYLLRKFAWTFLGRETLRRGRVLYKDERKTLCVGDRVIVDGYHRGVVVDPDECTKETVEEVETFLKSPK